MSILEYKRALLYRKAQGNVHRESYFKKIHALTGSVVNKGDFLTLEETDCIIDALKKSKVDLDQSIQLDNYQQIISFIKAQLGGLFLYLLIDEEWKYCGAYITNLIHLGDYNFDTLKSDEIRVIPQDLSFQILVDFDDNELTLEYTSYK